MPYNFVADGFHTKKFCSTFFKRSAILKIWTDLSSVLSQFTRLTDGRTDSFLVPIVRADIPCSAVENSRSLSHLLMSFLLKSRFAPLHHVVSQLPVWPFYFVISAKKQ